MRLLRYPGAPLLVSLLLAPLGCTTIIQDDTPDESSGVSSTSTTADDTTTTAAETTVTPDDTTSTGADSGSSTDQASSSDEGNNGQACGNGAIEGTELCDCGTDFCTPAGLNGAMCAGLINPAFPDRVYTGGVLDCSMASCQFVFTQCSFCGDRVLNGNEICEDGDNGPSCQDLGMGSSTADLPCGPDCQWHIACCGDMPPEDCD
jgi:hypothetical protein